MLIWWAKYDMTLTFHGLVHVSLIISEVEHFLYIYWALHFLTCSYSGQFRWIKCWQEETHMNLFKSIDKFCVSGRKRSYWKFFPTGIASCQNIIYWSDISFPAEFKCHLYHLLRSNIHLALCIYLSITVSKSVFIIALF